MNYPDDDISVELHEALAHQGLVTETSPLKICSADYRIRLELALRECGLDMDTIQELRIGRDHDAAQYRRALRDLETAEAEKESLRSEIKKLETEKQETATK